MTQSKVAVTEIGQLQKNGRFQSLSLRRYACNQKTNGELWI